MSEHICSSGQDQRWKLREALEALCTEARGVFVRNLATSPARWISVATVLHGPELAGLESLAYPERFDLDNLKAQYVLDEDFVDGGTAFVLFALVGTTWVHVVRLKDQRTVVPPEVWLEEVSQ